MSPLQRGHVLSLVELHVKTHQQSVVRVVGRRGLGRQRPPQVAQTSGQGHVGRATPPDAAAVIGDFKGTSLVIVQTTACTETTASFLRT